MPQVIGAVIPAVGAWFAGLAPLEAALVQLGGSLLLSAASKALMPQQDQSLRGRNLTVRQPVMPRDVVYGNVRKGGTIVYIDVNGSKSQYLDLVIVLATHRIKQIGGIYFNGQMVFAPGSTTAVLQYAGFAEIEQRLGNPADPSLTILTQQSAGKWTSAHRLRGCAHVWIRLKYDQDVYPSGIPNITFDLAGKSDIYDPRTGLSGYTDNPALCLADYMANTTWGIGAVVGAEDGIDTASLIAAANVCDEVVAKVGGGTERRYTCGGVVTLSQPPKTNIEAMLTAMAGTCGWQSGQWQLFAGAYRTPTITLTDDDIADSGFQLTTRVSQSDNFNAVRGQFISPENDWQPDDFPSYESAVYLAEDSGERKFADINLPFTTSASMAQRLAKIRLERQRRQMSVSLTGKLTAWRAAVGDVVYLTYARWGFAAKPFEVQSVGLALSGDGETQRLVPSLTLRETSPLVYDWTTSEAQIYAAAPRTTLPSAFNFPAPSGLDVDEQLYQTFAGSGIKVLARLTWLESPSVFVAEYQVEARIGLGPWLVLGRTDELTLDVFDIAPANWDFRVKALSQAGISSAYATVTKQIYGLSAPPSALNNITLQSAGGLAVLKWEQSSDLDVVIGGKIEIRHSSAASPAILSSYSMDIVPGASAIAVVPLVPGAYILRAVDSSGEMGPESIVPTSGIQAIAFASLSSLTEDAAFSGTKTDVVNISGNLSLDASTVVSGWPSVSGIPRVAAAGGYKVEGLYEFAAGIDLGSVKRIRMRSLIDMLTDSASDLISERLGNLSTWQRVSSGSGSEVDVVVEARTTPDDPSGAPTWGQWGRVDSTELQARGIQARAWLRSVDPTFTPLVSKLRLFADEAV